MTDFYKRDPEHYKAGKGLKSTRSFTVKGKSVDEIMKELRHTGLSARQTARATDILEKAISDTSCKVVLTLSGVVTVSKMGGLVCEMLDAGWIDCIIATGALIAHGTVEGRGGVHFEYDNSLSDEELYASGYDRIYDTVELESNLDQLDSELEGVWSVLQSEYTAFCSKDFCYETGRMLSKKYPDKASILKSAYEKKVPVIIPAFTDSELALDAVGHHIRKEMSRGKSFYEAGESVERFSFNPFKDLVAYLNLVTQADKMGILTLGGGVPRNYGQQVMPLIDILYNRLSTFDVREVLKIKKFLYAVRICPDPQTLGGLSGCSYSEGVSWGKFASESEGGEFAEIYSDYTMVLPWIVRSLQDRLSV